MKLAEIIDILKICIMNLNLTETLDIVRTLIMSLTALIAVFSFGNTIILWRKTNRPIISAFVETNSSRNTATTYNLLVINSGNRPAVDIQLKLVDIEAFKKCTTQDIDNIHIAHIMRCFNNEGKIPLLINGDKISNGFGITSAIEKDNIWEYGSSFPIEITYKDLEGKKYKSMLTLVIKYSKAFAGYEWSKEYKREDVVNLLQQIHDSMKTN